MNSPDIQKMMKEMEAKAGMLSPISFAVVPCDATLLNETLKQPWRKKRAVHLHKASLPGLRNQKENQNKNQNKRNTPPRNYQRIRPRKNELESTKTNFHRIIVEPVFMRWRE